ncbi:hypothetical protein MQE23_00420 [Streptomyces sp. HP-A2021]|uniref:hypothetical protein n=1 Tax=Streptomyces sp. HP-A2021 TaxID=2927875 RepID=UPI001FB017D6|nr:hypothetical protein [Streptomyces sp. HP-A2021]UOB07644.1 hypothetical protein MQE23_00420 [Streptomyces sp. HP-A2021]
MTYPYDMTIWGEDAWKELEQGDLGIVIDPLVFRVGQFFLAGRPQDDSVAAERWAAIEDDIDSLVSFFDLVVMHKQVPAFNYFDTFDAWHDFGDSLGELVNTHGDKTLVHVDVEHHMYRQVKNAAVHQLSSRLAAGPLVQESVGQEILSTLAAVQYKWDPSLETLEPQLTDPDQAKIARFLLGQLVFAGYAQQTGAPHLLAPKRGRMLTAVGLRAKDAGPSAEVAIYRELSRRFRDAGPGWRGAELPWTPSFLPFLLKRVQRYDEGPDVLLDCAKELRDKRSIEGYRKLRKTLVSEDLESSGDARRRLGAMADEVARLLDSTRQESDLQRPTMVGVTAQVLGATGGAVLGALVADPLGGAAAGAAAGAVGAQAFEKVNDRLWGLVIEGLTFRSARRLLVRSVKADYALRAQLVPQLRTVWESPRRAG